MMKDYTGKCMGKVSRKDKISGIIDDVLKENNCIRSPRTKELTIRRRRVYEEEINEDKPYGYIIFICGLACAIVGMILTLTVSALLILLALFGVCAMFAGGLAMDSHQRALFKSDDDTKLYIAVVKEEYIEDMHKIATELEKRFKDEGIDIQIVLTMKKC